MPYLSSEGYQASAFGFGSIARRSEKACLSGLNIVHLHLVFCWNRSLRSEYTHFGKMTGRVLRSSSQPRRASRRDLRFLYYVDEHDDMPFFHEGLKCIKSFSNLFPPAFLASFTVLHQLATPSSLSAIYPLDPIQTSKMHSSYFVFALLLFGSLVSSLPVDDPTLSCSV